MTSVHVNSHQWLQNPLLMTLNAAGPHLEALEVFKMDVSIMSFFLLFLLIQFFSLVAQSEMLSLSLGRIIFLTIP